MSYPTRADLFKKWSDAMLRGAIVGKPNYSQQSYQGKKNRRRRRTFRRRRRKTAWKAE